MLLQIARASLWNRRLSVGLTIFTVAISVALLLSVERLRSETRQSFASTISGTDLIVGARTGALQLLLYSVFRIGDATHNIRYSSYEALLEGPQIAWAVPLALGDSHRGFRVLGTTTDYFEHFRYADKRALTLATGARFAALHEAVLGADVATKLGYRVGDPLVIAHGTGNHDIMVHDDQPFRIVGILARTGTPVDRTIHVSLDSLEAIHAEWKSGVRIPQRAPHSHDAHAARDEPGAQLAKPETITAILVGLHNKTAALTVQRQINNYQGEALLAILPGLTLIQLWSMLGVAESALLLVAVLVVVAGLLGMCTALVTTLNERRREMAILRALGARPWQIGALLFIESAAITLAGMLVGTLFMLLVLAIAAPWLAANYGLYIDPLAFKLRELGLLLAILFGGVVVGGIPAWLAYRRSLADGLTIRT